MLYKTLILLKTTQGLTDALKDKIDIFLLAGRITEAQYKELMEIGTI